MRKLFLTCALTITIIALVAGCQQGASLIATPTEEAIVLPTPTHEPDFRSVNWGMSRDEVIQIEGMPNSTDKDVLFYSNIEVAGYEGDLLYSFEKDKLYNAFYTFSGSTIDYYDYIVLVNLLNQKYGKPSNDAFVWIDGKDRPGLSDAQYNEAISKGYLARKTNWTTRNALIEIEILYLDNSVFCFLSYSNPSYVKATPNTDGL